MALSATSLCRQLTTNAAALEELEQATAEVLAKRREICTELRSLGFQWGNIGEIAGLSETRVRQIVNGAAK